MEVFFRNKATFTVLYHDYPVSYDAPIFSDDYAGGNFTFVNRDDILIDLYETQGLYWVCYGERIWVINEINPEDDNLQISVSPFFSIFDRIHIDNSRNYERSSLFVRNLMQYHYKSISDSEYAYPYLEIINNALSDTLLSPEDNSSFLNGDITSGFFKFSDYLALLTKEKLMFRIEYSGSLWETNGIVYGGKIRIYIEDKTGIYNLYDGDSHTQKDSFSYQKDITSKVTVYVLTRNENNDPVINESDPDKIKTYYLQSDMKTFTTIPPTPRIPGRWEITSCNSASENEQESGITDETNAHDTAEKIFLRNTDKIQIVFYHDKYIDWGKQCKIFLGSDPWTGIITEVSASSDDSRYKYTIGNLKTTISQKLRSMF